MKKKYIIPELIVVEVEEGNLLDASPVDEGDNQKSPGEITESGGIGAKPHQGYVWDLDDFFDDEDK